RGRRRTGRRPRSDARPRPSPSRASEDLGAPGGPLAPEQDVRPGERTLTHLLDPPRPGQLLEGEAPEVHRGKRLDVELDVRGRSRAGGLAAFELPPPFVPGAEVVAQVEHHG